LEGLTDRPAFTPDRLDRPFADPLAGRLFPPLRAGIDWGLERTERALAELGDPHRAYATLHVGGTNGKGSVTSTVASIMRHSGRGAACYTSPHLCSFRERILIDGLPFSEDRLLEYAGQVVEPVVRFGLTFFEAITVLALHAFAHEGVEVAVMEVGLGGRLDATNVIRPEVSAVTNVAMDHADYLGDTLAKIAREKGGIMKVGVPFVTAEESPEILGIFQDMAATVGAPFGNVVPSGLGPVDVAADHTSLVLSTRSWGELELRTPLVGHHQATNAALAVEMLEWLRPELKPEASAIVRGVASVDYHGRDEVVRLEGRTWLFDVAHNTAGILSLVDTIDRLDLPRPMVALVGVLGDKDWKSMLPQLLSRVDQAILTQPPSAPPERRWDPDSAAEQIESKTGVRVVEDFVDAVSEARDRAGNGTVVVTGSVHTVGCAMSLLGLDPLGRL